MTSLHQVTATLDIQYRSSLKLSHDRENMLWSTNQDWDTLWFTHHYKHAKEIASGHPHVRWQVKQLWHSHSAHIHWLLPPPADTRWSELIHLTISGLTLRVPAHACLWNIPSTWRSNQQSPEPLNSLMTYCGHKQWNSVASSFHLHLPIVILGHQSQGYNGWSLADSFSRRHPPWDIQSWSGPSWVEPANKHSHLTPAHPHRCQQSQNWSLKCQSHLQTQTPDQQAHRHECERSAPPWLPRPIHLAKGFRRLGLLSSLWSSEHRCHRLQNWIRCSWNPRFPMRIEIGPWIVRVKDSILDLTNNCWQSTHWCYQKVARVYGIWIFDGRHMPS